jgi:tRNA U38,U39,U40 pseudouridine synthase TruA
VGRLSTDAMAEEAATLVGRHNFTSVRATGGSAASPVRELRALHARRRDGALDRHFVGMASCATWCVTS